VLLVVELPGWVWVELLVVELPGWVWVELLLVAPSLVELVLEDVLDPLLRAPSAELVLFPVPTLDVLGPTGWPR
jgi:hypothetical protein